MTDIRIFGVALGLLLVARGAFGRWRGRMTRGELLGWASLGLVVTALSVFPAIAEFLASLFRLRNRLLALLVGSVVLLFVLQLRARARARLLERRVGELVRTLATREFRAHNELGQPNTVAIIVPAYREEEAIEGVLTELPQQVAGLRVEPIVVVDGGEDETEEVVKRAGYLVATHPINRGQGDALRTGFQLALRRGADIVVTMDADGQHNPAELESLVKPIVADQADYVQGSRFAGTYDDAGGVRGVGIKLFTRLINMLARTRISDCTNGYRAIRAENLAYLRLEEDRFSAPEILMEASSKGLRMLETPVHIRSRSHGFSKKPVRLGYPIGFVWAILKVWLRS